MKPRFRALLAMPALLLALSACASGNSGSDPEYALPGTFGGAAASDPFLTFAEDGSLSGSDGCNNFTGHWTRDGNEVTIELGAMTLKACQDVDTWLSGAASASVAESLLTVHDHEGQPIGTLPRGS